MKKVINYSLLAVMGIGIIILTILILNGCAPDNETGGIKIIVDPAESIKTFLPPVSMVCNSYDITVKDSSLVIVIQENITVNTSYGGLLPDTYSINIIGLNDIALAIGEGDNTVVVEGGLTSDCTVTVVEYVGPGTLDLLADWSGSPGMITDPVIDAEMNYAGGTWAPMAWTLGMDQASFFDDTLLNGWYGIQCRIFDDGAADPSGGFATLARIAAGQVTDGIITLIPNALTGSFQVLIELDFLDPLDLTPNIPEGDINLYIDSEIVTVDISGGDIYGWFENGVAIGSSASIGIDPADYVEGYVYRLDLLGWSADGKHAGALSFNIVKSDSLLSQLNLNGLVAWGLQSAVNGVIEVLDESFAVQYSTSISMPNDVPIAWNIDSLDPGNYYLRTVLDNNYGAYFGGNATPPSSPNVQIPHDPGRTYNMIQMYPW